MDNDKFKVPVSSISELEKIVRGYAEVDKEVDLSSLEKLVGISKYTISKNNPFLLEVGIIEGGNQKKITHLGKKLGRAFEHSQKGAIKSALIEIVEANEFLSNVVSTVRIKGGLTQDKLASHILFAADLPDKKRHKTGARTVIDLLINSELLIEENGKIKIASNAKKVTVSESVSPEVNGAKSNGDSEHVDESRKANKSLNVGNPPSISINIQLHLPETENPDVYDNLFKSLRENLIDLDDA